MIARKLQEETKLTIDVDYIDSFLNVTFHNAMSPIMCEIKINICLFFRFLQ